MMKVSSLLSLCIDCVTNNLPILNQSDLLLMTDSLRNRILQKFTSSTYFCRSMDFKQILKLLLNKNTKNLDLTLYNVNDTVLELIRPCEKLSKLNIACDQDLISTKGLLDLIPHLKNILVLRISQCTAVNDDVLQCIAENCPKITGLDVGGSVNVTDQSLMYLSKLNNLTGLNFNKTQISNAGISCLVKGPSGKILEELRLSDCCNVDANIFLVIGEECPKLTTLVFAEIQGEIFSASEGQLKNLKQMHWTINF